MRERIIGRERFDVALLDEFDVADVAGDGRERTTEARHEPDLPSARAVERGPTFAACIDEIDASERFRGRGGHDVEAGTQPSDDPLRRSTVGELVDRRHEDDDVDALGQLRVVGDVRALEILPRIDANASAIGNRAAAEHHDLDASHVQASCRR